MATITYSRSTRVLLVRLSEGTHEQTAELPGGLRLLYGAGGLLVGVELRGVDPKWVRYSPTKRTFDVTLGAGLESLALCFGGDGQPVLVAVEDVEPNPDLADLIADSTSV
ncbi:MAG: DUF2283 domain-containing protein [Chloroflexi bacterium]|nr:DUF2283 domain-containing protein [Chloroflexota bacterium]